MGREIGADSLLRCKDIDRERVEDFLEFLRDNDGSPCKLLRLYMSSFEDRDLFSRLGLPESSDECQTSDCPFDFWFCKWKGGLRVLLPDP